MTERNKAARSRHGGNSDRLHSTHPASLRAAARSGILAMLLAGFIAALAPPAQADPVANKIFSECTFTTGAHTTRGTLNFALNIDQTDLNKLAGGEVQASYILIYVRQNPNDGQDLASSTSFTGPILCTNAGDTTATETTADALIPDSPTDTVNIRGTEEVSHLQFEPFGSTSDDNIEKRICHTVANRVDCFIIRHNP